MQFLIETDILYDYLTHRSSTGSVLRHALSQGVCYTTMLNAMELLRMAKSEQEHGIMMNLLSVVRVLGFNARYAESFSKVAAEAEASSGIRLSDRETMICGMAVVSKLTILTKQYYERYCLVNQVTVASEAASVPTGA